MRLAHKLPFVLAGTDQGTMIVNRLDYHNINPNDPYATYGVGYQILETGSYDPIEVVMMKKIATLKRRYREEGDDRIILALDCGANIGVHTIGLAKHMTGWGQVVAIEAQERLFYALCGNIALNNCMNAYAFNAAIHNICGQMEIPVVDYEMPASFGSLELIQSENNENIGQPVSFDKTKNIAAVTIDSFNYTYLDIVKMDIEGMETLALSGGAKTIQKTKPLMVIENLKCGHDDLVAFLEPFGYALYKLHVNTLAIHVDDPIYINKDLKHEINKHNWADES